MSSPTTATQTAGPADRAVLLTELHTLHRLTNTEVVIATVRRAQARDAVVRKELTENRDKGKARAVAIAQAIRDLGGIPGLWNPAAGRLAALAKTQLEAGFNPVTALTSDLLLEHDLHERVMFTYRLAARFGEEGLLPLLDRLENAHHETVDWIRARLNEIADGGTPALLPLPPQVAVGLLQNAVGLVQVGPISAGTRALRRGADALGRLGSGQAA